MSSEASSMLPIAAEKLKERLTRTPPVPITASGLQGEQPLAHRTKEVREVGKTDPYIWEKD